MKIFKNNIYLRKFKKKNLSKDIIKGKFEVSILCITHPVHFQPIQVWYSKIYSAILAINDSKGRIQLCNMYCQMHTLIVLHIIFIFLLILHQCICFVSAINNNGANSTRALFYIRICVFLYVLFIQISGIIQTLYLFIFILHAFILHFSRKSLPL